MASGTINLNNSGLTPGGGYLMGKIEWSSKADTAGNKSTVTARLYVKKASTTGQITVQTTGSWDCALTVNGEGISQAVYAGITAEWVMMLEKTVTAAHNSDGKKTITIAATAWGPSGSSYAGLQTTGSGNAALDNIPRASTLSAGTLTLGSAASVQITAAAANYRHDIYLKVGSKSVCLLYNRQGGGSAQITPKIADFAPQITAAASGSGTLTLYTFDANRNALGNKAYTVTVRVPASAGPTVSDGWANVTYDNDGTAAAEIAAFVQGYSRAAVTFDESKITLRYGAAIQSCKIASAGETAAAAPYKTSVLTGTTAEIVCTVVDSRGYTASETLTVDLYPYAKPALTDVSLYRSDADGTENRAGSCIWAKATLRYAEIGGANACTLQGFYRLQSGSYPEAGTELQSGTGQALTEAAAATNTYVAKIEARDSLGNTAAYEATIPTDRAALHLRAGGMAAGFGKYAEEDDLLDIAWNARVRKDLTVDGGMAVAGLLRTNLETKARLYSQTDDAGEKTAATITAYPTEAGVYRVGAQVAGLPSGGTGYGVLVIWDGGSYAFHLYRDNSGTIYSAKNSTANDAVQAPASWSKHTGTSVSAQK